MKVSYCCTLHQDLDQENHEPCFPAILVSPEDGDGGDGGQKYYVATRDIEGDELIRTTESPVLVGPTASKSEEFKTICLGCFKDVPSDPASKTYCSNCHWPMCKGRNCAKVSGEQGSYASVFWHRHKKFLFLAWDLKSSNILNFLNFRITTTLNTSVKSSNAATLIELLKTKNISAFLSYEPFFFK